jgi:stearoyl-CoA desaturase (delta-9 desaturase)
MTQTLAPPIAPRSVDRGEASPRRHVGTRLERPSAVTSRIAWRYAVPIATLHLLAMAACLPWLFSWTGVVLLVVGTYVYGGLGINIAYHRLLAHGSFKCPQWLERSFVVVALCCLEDAPASWVATHRLHHNDTDERPDPHSPLVSFLWSHVGWLLFENRDARSLSTYDRYARDVLRDPFYMRLERTLLPVWIYLAHALVYFLAGLVVGRAAWGTWEIGVQFGSSLVTWGVILRTVCVWHISWSVNSLTHLYGYRSYQTAENSRNNWLVALVSNGEGWHNNHHADPASASNAHRWWEFDGIYVVIRSLERLGLATHVVRPRHLRKP